MKNLKIKTELFIGFGVLNVLIIALVLIAFSSIYTLSRNVQAVETEELNQALILGDLTKNILTATINLQNAFIAENKEGMEKSIEDMLNTRKSINDNFDKLKALVESEKGKTLYQAMLDARKPTIGTRDQAIKLLRDGKRKEAIHMLAVLEPLQTSYVKAVNDMNAFLSARTEESNKSAYGKALIAIVMLGIAGLVISILVAFWIIRSITKPLNEAVEAATRIAAGDLTVSIDYASDDEIGQLSRGMNKMVNNLCQMFGEVATVVQTLSSSAAGLSSISSQMSQGADQTLDKSNTVASASEELSATMYSVESSMDQATSNINTVATATEEMTVTIRDIAGNAEKARGITGEAVSNTRNITEKVNSLGRSAREIGKITETISAISAQTNLLALNATIEAARAGVAGKGFAVVANEIKELAKQTAEATEDIRNKIAGIQESTESNVTDIQKISGIIQDVNEIVTTIAAAIDEQSIATKDIAKNIAEAAQGAQEVHHNVSESSKVSLSIAQDVAEVNQAAGEMSSSSAQVKMNAEDLSHLAEKLKELMSRFKVL